MRLVRGVTIRNFRSLRSSSMTDLDDYVPIVGLNGSGKSNVLRALNVFFTGQVEPDIAFDLKRDHFDPGRRFREKRRISIAVTFDLSADYQPRAEVEKLIERLKLGDLFTIEREYTYADPIGQATKEQLYVADDDGDRQLVQEADLSAVAMFIRSVRYRYVPNHIRPTDLIDSEIQTLSRAIRRRVRSRAAFREGGVQQALRDMGEVTKEMLTGVSDTVAAHAPEIGAIEPTIPSDFADLAFQLGISTTSSTGATRTPDLQGSGTQSYILFHLLDLVDRSAFEVDFGWTKAIVWAIEEPESFLHAGLRTGLASDLRSLAEDPKRQIFLTTHEPEFQRPARDVWIADREGATTTFRKEPARDAVVTSSRLRISSFQHPLFLSPDRPLVLVEGASDAAYLRMAAVAANLKPLWTLVSLEDLEEGKTGGDDVLSYLRANPSVLASRPLHAPVVVLRDWEQNEKTMLKIASALEPHDTSRCIRPPESLCNHELGQKFRGIERFLPTDVVEKVLSGKLRGKTLDVRYPLHIEKEDLDGAKPRLGKAMATTTDPGPHLIGLVKWLDDEVRAAVGKAPTSQMLLPF